ncbi:hypothetical protein PR048_028651 [Dryococelus australis]|uniref:Uncharacterized protein n=1 Tax=Dryococelus australis TaxID=614101 RepID=A0ABQ9GBM1_9NEOP|nr:hypothetical protein PR048_028651 [Dryococelus australis]
MPHLSKKSCQDIASLKSTTMVAELHFIISVTGVFISFTGFFQRNEPLIHVFHTELERLTTTLLWRTCKVEAIDRRSRRVCTRERKSPCQGCSCGAVVTAELMNTEEEQVQEENIDLYWAQFFEKKNPVEDLRYPTVNKVVNAALSLSHGNFYVELGFSD